MRLRPRESYELSPLLEILPTQVWVEGGGPPLMGSWSQAIGVGDSFLQSRRFGSQLTSPTRWEL